MGLYLLFYKTDVILGIQIYALPPDFPDYFFYSGYIQAVAVPAQYIHGFTLQSIAGKLAHIHAQGYQRQRGYLLNVEVGHYVGLNGGVDGGYIGYLVGILELLEYGGQHALLPVYTCYIRGTLALAAVVQHALPVQMLHSGVQLTAVHLYLYIYFVVHAAHSIYYFFYYVHIEAAVVADLYSHQLFNRRYGVLESFLLCAAALRKSVVYLGIGVAGVGYAAVGVVNLDIAVAWY